jgi:hypothetical protein
MGEDIRRDGEWRDGEDRRDRLNRRPQRSQRGKAATKAGGAPWAPIKRDHKTLFENGEPVRQETEPQIPQIAQIY